MSLKTKADALLRMATESGDVPGVVAVATDRNGPIYEGGFGSRVLGESAEMTPDTVVWIASMTKALTGTGAMQLVEQGKLSLDLPVGSIVTELGEAVVLEGFDADGSLRGTARGACAGSPVGSVGRCRGLCAGVTRTGLPYPC